IESALHRDAGWKADRRGLDVLAGGHPDVRAGVGHREGARECRLGRASGAGLVVRTERAGRDEDGSARKRLRPDATCCWRRRWFTAPGSCGSRAPKRPRNHERGESSPFPGVLGAGAGVAGAAGVVMSSSSTSNTSVAPPGILGGAPRSPYAMSDGQTSRALPPFFIIWTPSVQHLITPFSGNSAGSPRCTDLSTTLPSLTLPS